MKIESEFKLGSGGGIFDTSGCKADFTGEVSGIGSLNKKCEGVLKLDSPATYAGQITVGLGEVKVGPAGTLSGTSPIDLHAGTTIDVSAMAGGIALGWQEIRGKAVPSRAITWQEPEPPFVPTVNDLWVI